MLVYDVTKDRTFTNVSKWLRNIEEVSFCIGALTCTVLAYIKFLCVHSIHVPIIIHVFY